MKPPPFRYARPETLAETHELLATWSDRATLLAGGQSLLPLLNLRRVRPAVLIDLALVPELQVLSRDADALVLGAGVRQRTAETSPLVRETCPLLPTALRYVGHVQTRNRGTLGGSLAFAHPTAELAAAAVALEATVVAESRRGRRAIDVGEFFLAPHRTALAEDEVLTELRVPLRPATGSAFVEMTVAGVGVMGVAAVVQADEGRIADARLAAVGLAGTPLRLAAAEEAARDSTLDPGARARIAAAVESDAGPATGRNEAFRRRLVGTLVVRALAKAAA